MLEVELKFPLADADGLRTRLSELGAAAAAPIVQADAYYNHPSRDFAETDEALRLRTVGDATVVTYKGPRVVTPGSVAKTRFELETPLAPATADAWAELLGRLGFRSVAVVTKRRTPYRLQSDGRVFEVTLDEVEGVGLFAEVETVADAADRDAAERAVAELASELGLTDREPRSYLEMLLSARG